MFCSLGGLVTDAAREEMDSSSCSLVTLSLMLSTTSVFGTKGNCKTSARASIRRIITSSDVVPLVNAGVLQNFTNTICNEDWVFIG